LSSDHAAQHSRIRDRFTRTADQFSRFALSTRSKEAEHLAALVSPRGTEIALDLACGPGTFANAFALGTRFLIGFDLTPAMLRRARPYLRGGVYLALRGEGRRRPSGPADAILAT